jgi:hypothetical protein
VVSPWGHRGGRARSSFFPAIERSGISSVVR